MASLVLGAAGAVVGSFFGGPLGASIGWSLGAALGGALFQKGQQGPRLTDLKLQNSSYGSMIPVLYGMDRFAGQVIWQTDLHEHEHKSGGKGGPEITEYTYTASFAILLTECSRGPIGGVLRIWADSRLVWDRDVSTAEDFPFTLYLGTATQLPDPTIESFDGVGNVPAYRYRSYVVFNEIDLGPYNNRIPNLTFECFSASGDIPWRVSTFTPFAFPTESGIAGQPVGMSSDGSIITITNRIVLAGDVSVAVETRTYDYDGNELSTDTSAVGTIDSWNNVRAISVSNNAHIWAQVKHGSGSEDVTQWYTDGTAGARPISTTPLGTDDFDSLRHFPAFMDGCVYALGGTGTNWVLSRWPAPDNIPSGSADKFYAFGFSGVGAPAQVEMSIDEDSKIIWVAASGTTPGMSGLWKFDSELNLLHQWDGGAGTPPGFGQISTANYHRMLTRGDVICFYTETVGPAPNEFVCYRVNADNSFTELDSPLTSASPTPIISLGGGFGMVMNTVSHANDGIICINPPPAGITLGEIVADVSERVGLSAAQYDVSQLTDIVDGYLLTQQADGRSNIEPLQAPWPFDGVEHDVVMRFPRRGVDGLLATIPEDDLGAHVYGEEPPAAMVTEREQEVALPKQITAVFINGDADYQNGSQTEQRLITTSQLTTTLQLPIVMTDQKGRETAATILYNGWIERERFKLQLSRDWLLLEPADVVNASNRLQRLTQVTHGQDGVIRTQAVAESLQLYMQAVVAAPGVGMPGTGGTPPTLPPTVQDTDLLLLDLPLIRDGDSPNGFYAAMAGSERRSWAGATLFKSIDGGVTYDPLVLDTTPDTFGTCSTTLGDFTGGDTVDESNSVTVVVSLGSGELASTTLTGLLNGANAAAIGSGKEFEIIQFRDATLTAARTYVLTGLLRGRRGTEWMIGEHAADETFVLLPTSLNPAGEFAELFADRLYKGVTSGRALSTATPITFANEAIALRPYAPVELGGGRDASGNLTLNWTPRTRTGGAWLPGVDASLSDPSLYQIKIYTDGTYTSLVNVYSASSPTYDYMAADQTTDFGSPQNPVYWTVAQLGIAVTGIAAKGIT